MAYTRSSCAITVDRGKRRKGRRDGDEERGRQGRRGRGEREGKRGEGTKKERAPLRKF